MIRKLLSATSLTLAMLCGAVAAPAQAAPILGSHVESAVFLDTIALNTAGWTYLGSDLGSTSPFAIAGQLELKLRSSSYLNTFGTSDMNHTNRTEIFGANAGAGSIYDLAASPVDRLFYFGANGTDLLLASDDNRQYTDGFSSGGTPGRFQGGMDILYHAEAKTWAFFFDDAGGGIPILGDDNDYDDLVVTFRQYGVPEPGAVSLLGLALLGFAGMMRRRTKA
jgi:hypothetical protein